jgi:hypothetical protein
MPDLSIPQLRHAWMVSHGLDQPRTLPVPQIAKQFGWPRTLGGVDAYLAMSARNPASTPADLDTALTEWQLQVVPAARSCIYVVPGEDAPRAIRFGFAAWQKRTVADCVRAGSSEAELMTAVAATAEALGTEPQTTDELRKVLPEGVIRPLGELGKKTGMSTIFPAVIRWLEVAGQVERLPADGHLRNERYVWRKPLVNRVAVLREYNDPAALHIWLAQHYFTVAAPGRVRDFADWAGIGIKDATTAMSRHNLVALTVAGQKEPYFAPSDRMASLTDLTPGASPRLLSLVDPLTDYRDALQLLIDPQFHDLELPAVNGRPKPVRDLSSLWQRSICENGAFVGLWDFDPDARHVVTATFAPLPADRQKLLHNEAERVTVLLRDVLQDARSFSLDTDKSLRERAAFVRSLAAN